MRTRQVMMQGRSQLQPSVLCACPTSTDCQGLHAALPGLPLQRHNSMWCKGAHVATLRRQQLLVCTMPFKAVCQQGQAVVGSDRMCFVPVVFCLSYLRAHATTKCPTWGVLLVRVEHMVSLQ